MICRLCLMDLNDSVKDFIQVIPEENEEAPCNESVADIINKHFHIDIQLNDSVSNTVCGSCWQHVFIFNEFFVMINKKQQQLFLNESDQLLSSSPIPYNEKQNEIKDSTVLVEPEIYAKTTHDVDSDWYEVCGMQFPTSTSENENESLRYFYDEAVKMENEFQEEETIMTTMRTEVVVEKPTTLSVARVVRAIETNDTETINNHTNIPTTALLPQETPVKKLKRGRPKVVNSKSNSNTQKKFTLSQEALDQRRAAGRKRDEFMAANVKLDCSLCAIPLKDFRDLKAHFRDQHNCNGYMECCNKRYDKRSLYVDHLNLHRDPEYFRCKLCKKNYMNRNSYRIHTLRLHTDKQMMACECDVCGRRFAKMYLLNMHKKRHHGTERKEVRKSCDRVFRTPFELKAYEKRMHDESFEPVIFDVYDEAITVKNEVEEIIEPEIYVTSTHDVDKDCYEDYDMKFRTSTSDNESERDFYVEAVTMENEFQEIKQNEIIVPENYETTTHDVNSDYYEVYDMEFPTSTNYNESLRDFHVEAVTMENEFQEIKQNEIIDPENYETTTHDVNSDYYEVYDMQIPTSTSDNESLRDFYDEAVAMENEFQEEETIMTAIKKKSLNRTKRKQKTEPLALPTRSLRSRVDRTLETNDTETTNNHTNIPTKAMLPQQTPVKKLKRGLPRGVNSKSNSNTQKKFTLSQEVLDQSREAGRERDEFMALNVKLDCCLCAIPLEDFRDLKAHFREQHNCIGYVECCNKRYDNQALYVDHLNLHRDPEYFRCKLCKKNYMNRRTYEIHTLRFHTDKQMMAYECDVCGQCFAKMHFLTDHVRSHHGTERKDVRKSCDRAFHTPYELKANEKSMHNKSVLCDICGRCFRNESHFNAHKKIAHREGPPGPKVQCQLCGRWLRDLRCLRQHISRHNEGSIFKCDQCDVVKMTRAALSSHIRYHHSSKRHQCTLCGKNFKMARILKEHMATHTGIDLYACPLCPRTFKSHGNMYTHKKKMHSNDWVPTYSMPSNTMTIDSNGSSLAQTVDNSSDDGYDEIISIS